MTGVQTCALPIYYSLSINSEAEDLVDGTDKLTLTNVMQSHAAQASTFDFKRNAGAPIQRLAGRRELLRNSPRSSRGPPRFKQVIS